MFGGVSRRGQRISRRCWSVLNVRCAACWRGGDGKRKRERTRGAGTSRAGAHSQEGGIRGKWHEEVVTSHMYFKLIAANFDYRERLGFYCC
eukprot:scaffold21505_cov28-Tisochrysis_lutea.AAC.6